MANKMHNIVNNLASVVMGVIGGWFIYLLIILMIDQVQPNTFSLRSISESCRPNDDVKEIIIFNKNKMEFICNNNIKFIIEK